MATILDRLSVVWREFGVQESDLFERDLLFPVLQALFHFACRAESSFYHF